MQSPCGHSSDPHYGMQQRTSLVSCLYLFRHGSLKTIVLDMDNTLLVAGDDHHTVSLTFQPYLGEFLAMLLGPRASREDTYRPSKALETGRPGQGLWSMIQEVNRCCCVVMWPGVFGRWCAWHCGPLLRGAPRADNDGDHKGCKPFVDPLQTHIMACGSPLHLCLAYVCPGREG